MKILKKVIICVFNLCVAAGLGSVFFFSYQFGYGAFANRPAGNNESYKIDMVVQEGETEEEVANQLYTMNMIDSPKQFLFRARFSEYNGKLKPGTYEVSPVMGIDDILKRLTQMEDVK